MLQGFSVTDERIIEEIKDEIDESNFPYLTDIHLYESITNPDLLEHIDRLGQTLFDDMGTGFTSTDSRGTRG